MSDGGDGMDGIRAAGMRAVGSGEGKNGGS